MYIFYLTNLIPSAWVAYAIVSICGIVIIFLSLVLFASLIIHEL